MLQKVLLCLVMCFMTSAVCAVTNPLSVHVLNIQDGLPSLGVQVTLEQMKNGSWIELNSAMTNEQGRISAMFPAGEKLEPGTYKVTFKTGQWFKERGIESFFPEIPVVFYVDGKLDHYHIPLLLSPFGYSTYRGN